ncbi:site-specific integrase [Desulfobacula sp.]|uniref:tyrosine-type recombinase/integrase n=1 Tax=Desulfobacula sp. TaxID=2593537 RepID=UPI0025B8F7C3|nr:site-specific integrase [Desulfobacula sp.]MBC2705849.1 site-specific integrase [Desulfobacula sp.]
MGHDLRTQFVNHMILHRLSPYTIKNYLAAVKRLAKFHNKSPDLINNEQIQEYLLHLFQECKLSWGSCNVHLSGLSYFYKNILQWDETNFKLPPRPRIKKLPNILSIKEVKKLFESTANLKHRTLLKTVYSAGLRISEVVRLEPRHIESDPSRMMIRVEQGKGKKDRYTVLSSHLLDELRVYWQKYKPGKWIFPGYDKEKHIGYSGASSAYDIAKKKPA